MPNIRSLEMKLVDELFEMGNGDTLDRELPLDQVIARKARRAAETGQPFERVRDIFPR